jgi:2-polyprenyl-6-methoxyphenol hydroxylase-like FAD-dependent oxidoreductase
VIIGGGIGGVTAALALKQAGLSVSVYEAHPSLAADTGAFLTLAGNGVAALGQIEGAAPAREAGFGLRELLLLDAEGAELAKRPLAGGFRCLRWVELCATLQAQARRIGIPVLHKARLETAIEDSDGVTAGFADGSTTRGDLLIGSDGLNSTLRGLIDPAAAPRRYAGQRVFYGYSFDAPGRMTMIRGKRTAFGYAVSPAGETHWFCRVTAAELPPSRLAETAASTWRDRLLAALRTDSLGDDRTPAAGIVASTPDGIRVTNAYDLPDVPRWHTGRMLLIGDAAHAASPATGQGASLAIEDAVVLAKALRDVEGIGAAFSRYERLRRPRVAHNIETSARLSGGQYSPPAQRPISEPELAHQLDWNTFLGA